MKIRFPQLSFILPALFFGACKPASEHAPNKLVGTWQLLSSVYIKKDTIIHNDLPGTSMIKMLNDTHFAFMQHTIDKTDTTGIFGGGGGTYTLKDNQYTEHVEYCSARSYEGNNFEFTIEFHGDTLVQSGIEKLKEIGAGEEDMQLVEKYLRIK